MGEGIEPENKRKPKRCIKFIDGVRCPNEAQALDNYCTKCGAEDESDGDDLAAMCQRPEGD